MIEVLHNPRCTKSRQALQYLDDKNIAYDTILYLKEPLDKSQLAAIIEKTGLKPIDVVRKTEKDWKENFKGKEMDDDQVLEAMLAYPKLIQRPIIINKNKAVIGRPTEEIDKLL